MDKHAQIRSESAAFAALHRKVHETFHRRAHDKDGEHAHSEACRKFHAFEPSIQRVLSGGARVRLLAGDPELVEWAIAYIEVDPYHFASGYYKTALLRRLKWVALSERQQKRLQAVVLRCLDDPRRSPNYYLRIAASIQTPHFVESIRIRLDSPLRTLRMNAAKLLAYLENFGRYRRGKD